MHNDIHELSSSELNEASGGLGVLAGIALSVAANAIYDDMKDNTASATRSTTSSSRRASNTIQ